MQVEAVAADAGVQSQAASSRGNQEQNEKMELTQRERELAEQLEEDRWEILIFVIVTVFIVYCHPLTNTFGIANIISVI